MFDSRIDPIEDLTRDQHKAVIVVYTNDVIGYGSQHAGGPPFKREVDLCFEISQIASAPAAADPTVYDAGVPQTDSELEAELDRIESEIELALMYAPSGKLWRQVCGRRVSDPRSNAHRDSEEGVRLAFRSVIWKVQLDGDFFERLPIALLEGVARLPNPLRDLVEQLAATTYGAVLGNALGVTMPTMPIAVPLTDVTLGAEIVKPYATATGTPNINADAPLTGYPPAPPPPPATDSNPD